MQEVLFLFFLYTHTQTHIENTAKTESKVIQLTNDKDQNLNPYSRWMWILKEVDLLSKINLPSVFSIKEIKILLVL